MKMGRTDLVGDALITLKNASLIRKEEAIIPYSGLLFKICEILKREGYIENFRKIYEEKREFIKVYLKYKDKNPCISQVRRISKPSLRVYVRREKIPQVLKGRGLALVSTSKGLLTDKEARKQGLGGEILCYIW